MTTTQRAKRDPEGRKRAIIDATAQLITEIGITDVNHRRIAERAGVPLGATTQYFSSRDDLVHAGLEQLEAECDRDLDQLAADLTNNDDAVATFARYVLGYVQDTHQARAALTFVLASLHSPAMTELTKRWEARQHEVLTQHFDARFARAAATFAYGLYVQHAQTSFTPHEDDVVWALRRLADRD